MYIRAYAVLRAAQNICKTLLCMSTSRKKGLIRYTRCRYIFLHPYTVGLMELCKHKGKKWSSGFSPIRHPLPNASSHAGLFPPNPFPQATIIWNSCTRQLWNSPGTEATRTPMYLGSTQSFLLVPLPIPTPTFSCTPRLCIEEGRTKVGGRLGNISART
ncbi:hypothetical protein K504DRAFT_162865 [Pleomassaria siparia CBS 279.74]|uniref:Uncharacterized protein n=1 Tax=Pleomassaria siparia CBS 279.74 TaxID=1314801 RepID=A0A6G1JUK8_9PLEO|nr:hypothetical protein K504DRAFT_162865 [Pleomassaria siparia CBS 279.74]